MGRFTAQIFCQAILVFKAECAGDRWVSEVAVHQQHARAAAGKRLGKVDRNRCLALAGRGTGDKQDLHPALAHFLLHADAHELYGLREAGVRLRLEAERTLALFPAPDERQNAERGQIQDLLELVLSVNSAAERRKHDADEQPERGADQNAFFDRAAIASRIVRYGRQSALIQQIHDRRADDEFCDVGIVLDHGV